MCDQKFDGGIPLSLLSLRFQVEIMSLEYAAKEYCSVFYKLHAVATVCFDGELKSV